MRSLLQNFASLAFEFGAGDIPLTVGSGTQVSGNPGGLNGSTQHSARTQFAMKTKAEVVRTNFALGTSSLAGIDSTMSSKPLFTGGRCTITIDSMFGGLTFRFTPDIRRLANFAGASGSAEFLDIYS
jgi:hypothetical protein